MLSYAGNPAGALSGCRAPGEQDRSAKVCRQGLWSLGYRCQAVWVISVLTLVTVAAPFILASIFRFLISSMFESQAVVFSCSCSSYLEVLVTSPRIRQHQNQQQQNHHHRQQQEEEVEEEEEEGWKHRQHHHHCCSVLLYFTLLLLYSSATPLHPTHPTPLLSTPHSSLLYSILLYSTLLYSTLLYSTLLYFTLLLLLPLLFLFHDDEADYHHHHHHCHC